jgi:epoxyqueuosine reductase QueG
MNKEITSQKNTEESVFQLLRNEYVDYIGFADLTKYEKKLAHFGGEIVKGYKYGISIGIALPNSIVDFLSNRNDSNIASEYKIHCYNSINDRLNLIASKVASFLNQQGCQSLPIPAAERTNEDEAIPTVSHKMIAHIAGLGWIGKSCLLVTLKHGPRVRFISVLTNAPINGIDNPLEQRCNDCQECMKICPAHAIKGINYKSDSVREDRLDFMRCQEYFYLMKKTTKWDVCGMCLYICPYGRKK